MRKAVSVGIMQEGVESPPHGAASPYAANWICANLDMHQLAGRSSATGGASQPRVLSSPSESYTRSAGAQTQASHAHPKPLYFQNEWVALLLCLIWNCTEPASCGTVLHADLVSQH